MNIRKKEDLSNSNKANAPHAKSMAVALKYQRDKTEQHVRPHSKTEQHVRPHSKKTSTTFLSDTVGPCSCLHRYVICSTTNAPYGIPCTRDL